MKAPIFLQRFGWTLLVALLFGLGRWVAGRGAAQLVVAAPVARGVEMPSPATDETYEGRLRWISAETLFSQWTELAAIPEAERDLAWPARCGALWERWAEVDLAGALAALPAAPPLPPPPAAHDPNAPLKFRTIDFSSSQAANSVASPPEWVADLPRHAVFAAWARRDLAAALAKAEGLPAEERVAALRGVMETLAVFDPGKFLAEAARLGPVYTEYDRLRAFAAVAKIKPLLAAEFAEQVATGQYANWDPRGQFLSWGVGQNAGEVWQVIMRTWAHADPRAAAAYLENTSSESVAYSSRLLVLAELVKLDPALAAKFLLSEQWGKYGGDLMSRLEALASAEGIGFRHLAALFPYLSEVENRDAVFSQLIQHVRGTKMNFGEVKNFYRSLPSEQPSTAKILDQLLPRWREEDAAGAISAIQALPLLEDQKRLLNEFVSGENMGGRSGLSLSELRARLALLPPEYSDELKAHAVEKLNLKESDPAQIRQLVEELPAGKLQEVGVSGFYRRWLDSEPDFDTVSQALENDPLSNLVSPWIYGLLSRQWAGEDSLAASEWIQSLPNGLQRDSAIRSLVEHLAEPDPDAAVIWLQAIQDGETQRKARIYALDHATTAAKQRFEQALENHSKQP